MTGLSNEDRKQLIGRYVARFQEHGVDGRALNVGDPEKYARQHGIHAAVGPLDRATVLDIGCGLASFYEYIRQRWPSVRYVGYDVVEPFVQVNRERFPDAIFRVQDISRDAIADSFDYAVMCQVFNNKYQDADNVEVIRHAIRNAFAAAQKGVSVDMLSSYVSYRDAGLFYYQPEQMFSFAKSLTPFVSLLHDYLEHHFTLRLYKSPVAP